MIYHSHAFDTKKRETFFDEEAIVLPLAITKTLALELSQIGY